MASKALFITGTDTAVGKTVVSACLIKVLQGRGYRVAVAKPFESGANRDGAWLKYLTGQPSSWDGWAFPYRLKAALAPALAAEREGVQLSIPKVIAGLRRLEKQCDVLLVEGAGGALVPLGAGNTVADLIAKLGYSALVVARLSLGTINHSLLTLEALRGRGCAVAGIVFNQSFYHALSEAEKLNPSVVAKLGQVRVLGQVPYLAKVHQQKLAGAAVLERYFVVKKLLK